MSLKRLASFFQVGASCTPRPSHQHRTGKKGRARNGLQAGHYCTEACFPNKRMLAEFQVSAAKCELCTVSLSIERYCIATRQYAAVRLLLYFDVVVTDEEDN